MNPSKRYKESLKLVDPKKVYSVDEAVEILKNMPHVKFDETLDVNCKLSIDPKQSEQMVRGSVSLPFGTGKKVKVIVFCEPEKEEEAKKAGADYVGSQEVIEKIAKEGWIDFDYCISTPAMMKFVSKLGKVLGPKGLMPSPKTGTVTQNIAAAVNETKKGKVNFRMDKFGCIYLGLGKVSFSNEALVQNIRAFIEALLACRPSAAKGEFVKTCFLSTTMSPSLRISI